MINFKNINYKKLLTIIFLTIIIGSAFSFLINSNMRAIDILKKPNFYPPKEVFIIVWTILYILMSISLYITSEEASSKKKKTELYYIYLLQLIVNSLWTVIFFEFQKILIAFVWIIVLILLVILMISRFFKINKFAAYLQIPYVIWLFIALYLNYSIYILNR